jgi:hypothetical protein
MLRPGPSTVAPFPACHNPPTLCLQRSVSSDTSSVHNWYQLLSASTVERAIIQSPTLPSLAVSNFCSGDICTLPTEQALVAQRGLPETVCQALCLSPDAGGLSPANASLVQPPYQIANNLQAEPLNTLVRGRCGVGSGWKGPAERVAGWG